MKYNELSEEETYVIEKKEQKDHFLENIMIFMKMVFINAKNVMPLYIDLKINFLQVAVGLVLMMR